MENTKKKCEDYLNCNIKDKDGYCMNNDLSCIWREGTCADTSERQLTIPDVIKSVCEHKWNWYPDRPNIEKCQKCGETREYKQTCL